MKELTSQEKTTVDSYNKVAGLWETDHSNDKFWGDNFDVFHKLLPTGRILEIGCGAGRDAQELIGMGYDYTGTDIAGNLLELARKNNPGSKFEEVSLYDLDFDEPFDGFWCAAVLIHLPKERIHEGLQAIKKNLKTKAIGFIAIKEGSGERLEERPELNHANFLFTYWQNDEFKDVLGQNGFDVVHEDYLPFSERTKWLTYIVKNT